MVKKKALLTSVGSRSVEITHSVPYYGEKWSLE